MVATHCGSSTITKVERENRVGVKHCGDSVITKVVKSYGTVGRLGKHSRALVTRCWISGKESECERQLVQSPT